MADVITISKVDKPPSTLTPNTMYLVKGANGEFFESYFSSKDGTALIPGINEAFVNKRIEELASNGFSELFVVANIVERDSLDLQRTSMVYVIESTGDGFGSIGEVLYLYNFTTKAYHRITGVYQLVQWGSVLGKPESSPEAIDTTVAAAHTHNNLPVLDKLSVDANGELLFNGTAVSTVRLVRTEW